MLVSFLLSGKLNTTKKKIHLLFLIFQKSPRTVPGITQNNPVVIKSSFLSLQLNKKPQGTNTKPVPLWNGAPWWPHCTDVQYVDKKSPEPARNQDTQHFFPRDCFDTKEWSILRKLFNFSGLSSFIYNYNSINLVKLQVALKELIHAKIWKSLGIMWWTNNTIILRTYKHFIKSYNVVLFFRYFFYPYSILHSLK